MAGTVLVSLVVGALGIGLGATPAYAVRYGLPDRFCLYEDFNFAGDGRCFTESDVRAGLNLSSHNFDNRASSLVNNLSFTVCFYLGDNRQGGSSVLGRYSFWRFLDQNAAPDGGSWNNKISSLSATPCSS